MSEPNPWWGVLAAEARGALFALLCAPLFALLISAIVLLFFQPLPALAILIGAFSLFLMTF